MSGDLPEVTVPRLKAVHKALIALLLLVAALALAFVVLFPPKGQLKASGVEDAVVLSQCLSCHRNLDGFKTPGVIFKHAVHFEKGIRCASCHRVFPHIPRGTVRVSMDICYACHGLRHSEKGLVAGESCQLCHPPEFNLIPSTHTAQFRASLHKDDAPRDLLYCRMCHTEEWCSACHDSRKVTPGDHRAKDVWKKDHGKGAKDISGCAVCHNATTFCEACHRTPIPHTLTWVGRHDERARIENESCKACHQDRGYCEDCHHGQLPSKLLVTASCEKCHSDYKLPLLLVKGRTHMVHKAHLELTNTAPFTCEDCHDLIKKGKTSGLQYYAVCYECHGKYRAGKLIAKWGGYELCYRCHQGGVPLVQELERLPLPAPPTSPEAEKPQLRKR